MVDGRRVRLLGVVFVTIVVGGRRWFKYCFVSRRKDLSFFNETNTMR